MDILDKVLNLIEFATLNLCLYHKYLGRMDCVLDVGDKNDKNLCQHIHNHYLGLVTCKM